MHRILFFMSLLAAVVGVRGEIIRGRIIDAETHEAIIEAQISCTYGINDMGRELSVVDDLKVDSLGQFQFRSNMNGRINIRLIGYHPKEIHYFANSNNNRDTVDLGNIMLKPSEVMMKALEVNQRLRRFTMRGDTIVFNPEAFHLEKGARLEELIAQLPGVETNGRELSFNGKPIRVVMNGESLFGSSDAYMRLPAEAVETIKAYNKASEFSERTGKDDGGEDMVLDLHIKSSFLDKFYGDINAAYQTPKHYKVDLDIQKLSNSDPLLIAADVNNLNQKIRRSMNSGGIDEANGFGQEQYGAFGYQHNWKRKEEGQTLNGNWSVSGGIAHNDNWNRSREDVENFCKNDNYNYTTSTVYQRSHSLEPNVEVTYFQAVNAKNTFSFSSKIDNTSQRNKNETRRAQFDELPHGILQQTHTFVFDSLALANLLLYNHIQSKSSGRNTNVKVNARWTHYIKDVSLNITANVNYNKDLQEGRALRVVKQFSLCETQKMLNQISRVPNRNLSSSLTASGSKWIAENVLISARYRLHNSRRHNNQDFFENNTLNVSNTYSDKYKSLSHTITISSTINTKAFKITPEVSWQLLNEHEEYKRGPVDTISTRRNPIWRPQLKTTWKINNKASLEFNYDLRLLQPNLLETIHYHDDSDPLYIREGNTNLRNTSTNNLSLTINAANTKHQRMTSLKLKLSASDRFIQYILDYNPKTSVYTTYPKMVKGGKQGSAVWGFDQGLGNEFRLKNNFNIEYGRSFGFLIRTNTNEEWQLNRRNSFSSSESITLNYDHIWLKSSIFATIAMTHLEYSNAAQQNTTLWKESVGARLNLEWKYFAISSNLTEFLRHGYLISTMNRNYMLWDAALTIRFLHNKASLKFEVNDILNQLDTFYAQQTAYQNSYSWSELMHHNLNISFTYHFDAKEKK